jgi:phage terminase large subunit-like protein
MNKPALVLNADDAAAELCKRPGGFKFFVKEFWDIVVADALEWNWHMDVLCNDIEAIIRNVARYGVNEKGQIVVPPGKSFMAINIKGELVWKRNNKLHDLIINVPPGTSKSTICTIMAPAWAWVIDPTLRIITGSHTDSLATEHAVKSRDILESQRFRKYFPEIILKYDKNNKTNYENTLLGQRMATSVGAKGVMGKHAHLIIIDDPIDPKGAKSQAEILAANSWMDTTLSQRKVNKAVTPTILVMQRLSTNDPTGHLLAKKKEKLKWICLPAVMSNDVLPGELRKQYHKVQLAPDHQLAKVMGTTDVFVLDKNRVGPDVIAEAMTDLGGDGYAGQFDQRPVKEGGLIWRKWFIEIDDVVFPPLETMSMVGTDWDLAYTDKEENAASAYITAGKIGHKMFIDDLGWARKEFPELIKYMKLRRRPHYIEAKASGKSAKQTLVKNGIPAMEVKVEGGADKIARAKMATPYPEAGMVCIRKSLADRLYNDSRQGILSFPRNPDKDLADVLAQAIQRLMKGGIITSDKSESYLDSIT